MNDHPIDDIVRRHLDREAATVDAEAMLARLKDLQVAEVARLPLSTRLPHGTLASSATGISRRVWLGRAAALGGAAVAASVGGILFFGPTAPEAKAMATAEELITEAKSTHELPTDRLYEVTTEWEPAALKKLQIPAVTRGHRVWTRGDLYWVQPLDDANWCMGQDSGGHVWFALGRKRGLGFDASEFGEPMLRYLDLVSLRFASTLAELLAQFKLYRKDGGQPGEPIRIEAEIKPGFLGRNPKFQFIKLELDPETKAVREASFERKLNGESVGRMRFKLLESANRTESDYDVRGHLDSDAEIVDRKNERRAKFREEFLKRVQSKVK